MGVQLLEAYSEAELDELGDFAPTDAVRDLVPKWQDFAVVAFVACSSDKISLWWPLYWSGNIPYHA